MYGHPLVAASSRLAPLAYLVSVGPQNHPSRVKERSLTIDTTSATTVVSSFNVNSDFPKTFFKGIFTALTMCSKNPPNHGAAGELNDHRIFNTSAATLNVAALSESISLVYLV